jgi:hypothetical protein
VKRTLLYAAVTALLSGALLGCFDAIAPRSPHARGISLSIAPVFVGAAAQDGVPGDVDLIRIVLHNPPQADTTLNIPVEPGQDSIIIHIDVTLNGSATDTVGVSFQAIRSSDGTVLYSGAQSYQVSAGVATSGSPFVVTYVGPGQNILSIAISPRAATIRPGDSIAFSSLALDSTGATIVGMPILFDSRNTAIVTVDAVGVARGVALGSTYVVLTSGARAAVKDSALVTVSTAAPPAIALSAAAAAFLDTAGTSDPAAQTINVTNGGGGVLSGLSLGTIVYGAGATGWLAASLAATTAPTTLTLAAAKGSLAPGTYTATVPVQAAGASNTPQTVTVTFTIVAAVPAIGLSTAAVNFVDTLLTADPAAQTVTITNTGLGTLSGLAVGTISYGVGGSGWLTATLGAATAPTTLSLAVAKGSLAAGTYTATVPVQSAGASNSPQSVSVSFTVVPAPTIGLSSGTVTFNDTLQTSDPANQTVNVTSTGGTLTGLSLGTISYASGTGWLTTASLNVTTTPATLTLGVAKGSLAAGTYTATVPVQAALAGNSPASVTVTFNISAPPALVTLTGTPGYGVMQPGDQVTYAVTGKDGSGNPVTPFGLSYTSRNPGVATVNAATGLITAVSSGTAVIVAQAPTATGTTADSTLVVIPAGGSPVVAAIGDGRAFDAAGAGNTVNVLVLVDLRAVPGDTLGSYNATLTWNSATLTFVSDTAVAGGFAAPTVNAGGASAGQLRFGSADPSGSAGAFALIQVTFTAAAAGTTPLTLTLTDLSTAKTFVQLLPAAVIVPGSTTVH